MIYGLPETPTREDVRREYTIVNMRFKELQAKMEPRNRSHVSELLGYVRDDLRQNPNPEDVLPDHTSMFLVLAEGTISKYRGETRGDLELADQFCREMIVRHIGLIRSRVPFNRNLGGYLSIAACVLEDAPAHSTYTTAIDKAMFMLGEAEKMILEAEQQKPVPVGV